MAIQGPLRELGVHDVFQLLDLGKKTGILKVVSDLRQNQGTIWFHEAAVVAATIKANPHPLGQHLIKAGRIAPEDLGRAQALQAAGDGRRIGEILVGLGLLGAKELAAQVRAQIEDVVFTMLGGLRGTSCSRRPRRPRSPRKLASGSRSRRCSSRPPGGSMSGRGYGLGCRIWA